MRPGAASCPAVTVTSATSLELALQGLGGCRITPIFRGAWQISGGRGVKSIRPSRCLAPLSAQWPDTGLTGAGTGEGGESTVWASALATGSSGTKGRVLVEMAEVPRGYRPDSTGSSR